MRYLKNKTLYLLIRYGIVGLTASVVHFLVSFLCNNQLMLNPYLSHFFGFIFGLFTAYTGHYFYSFKDNEKHSRRFPRFFITAISALILHQGGVYIFVGIYHLDYSYQVLPLLLVSVPVFTFLMSKFWVFSEQK